MLLIDKDILDILFIKNLRGVDRKNGGVGSQIVNIIY